MNRPGRPDPEFAGFRRASGDFKRVQNQFSTELLAYELDLTNARTFAGNTFADLPFAGNSFYVDQNSDVGNASVLFANQQTPGLVVPVFVQAGFIARAPFTRLMIANVAQVGKKLRFFYGVDIDFVPSINGALAISGTVSVTAAANAFGSTLDQGFTYGTSFKSNTGLAANTPETIFTPAANVNGAIVWEATYSSNPAASGRMAILAKTSAPGSVLDGDVIASDLSAAATGVSRAKMQQKTRIAAGKGLYRITDIADGLAMVDVLYTLI